ncbi:hypothetical protein AB7942_29780 [Neobacillus sp. BF23-41]
MLVRHLILTTEYRCNYRNYKRQFLITFTGGAFSEGILIKLAYSFE